MQRLWSLLFGVVLLGAFVLSLVSPSMGWWLPKGVSTYAPDIDWLFYFCLFWVTLFYVLTEVILVWNMWAYGGPRKAAYTHGNNTLEMVWTAVPAVILITIAVIQIPVWASIKYPTHLARDVAAGTEKIFQLAVEARQWEYRVRYRSPEFYEQLDADGKLAQRDFKDRMAERYDDIWLVNDVHTWQDIKTVIHFKTRDVGHSLFFPNLRLKQDALPGRTIPVWFNATVSNTKRDGNVWLDGFTPAGVADRTQIYDLVCTQYCGSRHSLMRGKLYVHPTKDDFTAWLKAERDRAKARTVAAAN